MNIHSFLKNLIFTLSILSFLPLVYLTGDTTFIFIVGGSAAGKTTFAKTLARKYTDEKALVISLDHYLDKRVQDEKDYMGGIPNFDNPSMINWELLLKNLSNLQNKLPIQSPIYDFGLWMATGYEEIAWKPVVIIEGIHATQNDLDSIPGLRIYMDVDQDIRYQRRIVRDMKERNYPLELIQKTFFQMAVPYQKLFLDSTRYKINIFIHNLEGDKCLEKAANYIIDLLMNNSPTSIDNIKYNINFINESLIETPF